MTHEEYAAQAENFKQQYENVPLLNDDQLDAVITAKHRTRSKLTRRIRLRLAAWHLKCALAHLWRVVRG